MDLEEIKTYWEERATQDHTMQSTTQDIYLREIEFKSLFEKIQKHLPCKIADIGSGDGMTTINLASNYKNGSFSGYDYASSMVDNAKLNLSKRMLANVEFKQGDVLNNISGCYDLIYTTRCLINLPSWELQKIAISNIHKALTSGGHYIMIENFIEGHNNFNEIRKKAGLSEISVRSHNLFFKREELIDYISDMFLIEEEVNISSTYYLVSRIIYSKICSELNREPDYFDTHHRLAALLPFTGEYGPVRLICLKKK